MRLKSQMNADTSSELMSIASPVKNRICFWWSDKSRFLLRYWSFGINSSEYDHLRLDRNQVFYP
jgi:hypothetical protein